MLFDILCIHRWLEGTSNPSWNAVLTALVDSGQSDAAEKVKVEYGLQKEGYLSTIHEPHEPSVRRSHTGHHGDHKRGDSNRGSGSLDDSVTMVSCTEAHIM